MHARTFLLSAAILASATAVAAQVPADSDRPAADLYKTTCQPCHMADGNAALEPMNFADGKWRHGSTTKEITAIIANGVQGTAMMPFKTRFSDKEIAALAKYVRTFDKALKPEAAAAAKPKAKKKPTT
jgi:mono/diheme cytochrome c family protein